MDQSIEDRKIIKKVREMIFRINKIKKRNFEIKIYNASLQIFRKQNTSDTQSSIDKILNSMIIGQENAIKEVSQAIKRSKVGLSPQNKPIASFLCIGKTGVGKTLMAKILAKEIFGDEKYLVRFDMSEYADSVNKLVHQQDGYQEGLLTEAVNKKHCVLLIEK